MPRPRDRGAPRKSLADLGVELHAVWLVWAATYGGVCPEGWSIGAAYIRESHKDSMQGHSPSAQLKGTLEDAARNRIWIPWEHVFIDNITGRTDQRPAFLEVVDLVTSGRVSSVSVFHSSRFARNVGISRKWKDEFRRRGVAVRALNIQIDTATPEGRLMETVQEAFDEYQSDSTGQWIRVALRTKHETGLPLGNLPETYFKDASGTIQQSRELCDIVIEGARRYISDAGRKGFGGLAQWSNEQGHRTPAGRRLTKEWWRNTLRNPLCAGYVGYRRKQGGRELRKAAFAGFMELELFQKVQRTRESRIKHPGERPSYHVYVLSGSHCPCGGKIVATTKHRLRCRNASQNAGCPQPSVKAADVERQFRDWLPYAVALPNAMKPRLVTLIRAKLSRRGDAAKAEQLRVAVKRLTDAWTWGGMEEADYRAELKRLQDARAAALEQPEEARILAAVKLAQDLPTLWDVASPERRKELFWSMFEKATVADGKLTGLRPRPAIAPLIALNVHICGPDRGLTRGIEL